MGMIFGRDFHGSLRRPYVEEVGRGSQELWESSTQKLKAVTLQDSGNP